MPLGSGANGSADGCARQVRHEKAAPLERPLSRSSAAVNQIQVTSDRRQTRRWAGVRPC
jgi:hypothetical protein